MLLWLALSAHAGFYDGDSPNASFGQRFDTTSMLIGSAWADEQRGLALSTLQRRGWMVAPCTRVFLRTGTSFNTGSARRFGTHGGGGLALDLSAIELYGFVEAGAVWGRTLPDGVQLLAQGGAGLTARRRPRSEELDTRVRLTWTLEGRYASAAEQDWWTVVGAIGLYVRTEDDS